MNKMESSIPVSSHAPHHYQDASLFEEWLKQDVLSENESSPEIATPLDPFITSPTNYKEIMIDHHNDLDVSSVLDSPQQINPLFAEITESFPAAALAALATNNITLDAAMASATTPAFSTKRKKGPATPDETAMKRQKNTDAARRSRLRKVQKMSTLEDRVSELEKSNANLTTRVAVLDSEKNNLEKKEVSYEKRIQQLEEQLAEAHRALYKKA
jgi:predicted RNase H-like nuclease (RuvC/YqgF family)